MPGQAAVVGTSYYGRIDGIHTKAVLVTSNQNAQDGSRFYVLAVPAKDTEDRAHKIRDTQTGAQLWVKLVALDLLSGLKKNPYQRQTYADWGEGHPRLDDLQSLTRVPAALPLNMAGAVPHILLSEAEVDGTSDPAADTETEVGPAILNLFNPVNPEEPPARNETEAAPSPCPGLKNPRPTAPCPHGWWDSNHGTCFQGCPSAAQKRDPHSGRCICDGPSPNTTCLTG